MLDSLVDLVTSSSWTYLVLFAFAAVDAVFPAVPSETAVIAAGVLAGTGDLELLPIVLAGAAGAWTGDNTSYTLGRRVGHPLVRRLFRGERSRERLDWARRQLDRRGGLLIVTARFIPGGRTATTLSAGIVHYPWLRRFLPFSILAAVLWASYAGLAGYLGGRLFEDEPLIALLVAFGLVVVITLGVEGLRRRRRA